MTRASCASCIADGSAPLNTGMTKRTLNCTFCVRVKPEAQSLEGTMQFFVGHLADVRTADHFEPVLMFQYNFDAPNCHLRAPVSHLGIKDWVTCMNSECAGYLLQSGRVAESSYGASGNRSRAETRLFCELGPYTAWKKKLNAGKTKRSLNCTFRGIKQF
eukprot:15419835-Alexandrium_andersonii.AAC.1